LKIIHFADLHLGVESYGRIDPATGLSSRFLEFLSALDQLIDFALKNKVDLVLFCGDAYKSRDPSQTQQREFARRISRLSSGGIPTFLLIGNHDLHNAIGRATTTEIFDTLAVKSVYVANRPYVYKIDTPSGIIQIISLPWLRRSALLSREDTKNLGFDQINQKMQEVLTGIINTKAKELDPKLPSVLAAHVWVSGARVGSEKSLTISQEHVLMLSNIANLTFDYIALGHIHKHQVLSSSPPVVYAGSLGRLDFSDEGDDKGFYLVEIESDAETGKRQTTFKFQPINGRRLITINVGLELADTDPTATVLKAIAEKEKGVSDAIVRLLISLPQELEGQIRDSDIRNALAPAHYYTIAKDIKRESRLRLGDRSAEEITPAQALKAYLEATKVSPERTKPLLEYGARLIEEERIR
jgi:exonuclease SbcD|tara:strand:- start:276 stop:1514 length:1239 start_codon:yes stop_codon:yes gene_type:complete